MEKYVMPHQLGIMFNGNVQHG